MTREQLSHVLRAAAEIVDDPNILVIGSQSVLGTYAEEELPPRATLSMEADVAFLDDENESKADAIDMNIGEGSQFNQTHGFYAQGVTVETAVLPSDWRDRVVSYARADTGKANAICLEVHDLVISKLVAAREKDREFAVALMSAGMLDIDVLKSRASLIPKPGGVQKRVLQSIERCLRIAGQSSR